MDFGLKDKVVVVTGATGGIGRAAAVAFAAEGARVVATYHANPKGAQETVRRAAGGEVIAEQLDQADPASVTRLVKAVKERWGGIDVLVNNAVAMPAFPAPGQLFETEPPENFAHSLQANLLGPYLLSQAVVGSMRAKKWGRIVHVSSTFAEDGFPGRVAYASAKAGLHGLTRVMSRELGRAGILTNAVLPGFTPGEKPMSPGLLNYAAEAAATKRVTTPEDVANTIVFLGSQANTNVTGELVRVDGHFLTPAP
ncbi:3-oxoacyl-[acyl-carrier protein] reductase [Kitasatospora sp. MAA4]|uniref:SDR family NAD(P)-dependent oxidoreductase n=1 Tax=Kitasatospora sp. MAA4 TaxID=3035093 RepID=UPI0024740F76|nr:SDR family oxidoreductase [Kitasatospora sp. MAA4]MDH6131098.1 3-oxoacyl-[acyl-carrier protein] reductase [Kitasatospora sp. MAA4]